MGKLIVCDIEAGNFVLPKDDSPANADNPQSRKRLFDFFKDGELPVKQVITVPCDCGSSNSHHSDDCAITENFGSDKIIEIKYTKDSSIRCSGASLKKV